MLGLESEPVCVGVASRASGLSSFSKITEFEAEIMDEMLLETECPGLTVTVLEVSLDTSESGLGINSRVSEKPTLPLLKDFLWAKIGSDAGVGDAQPSFCPAKSAFGSLGFSAWGNGNEKCLFRSCADGLDGALLPLETSPGFFGRLRPVMLLRSWLDMAAERR